MRHTLGFLCLAVLTFCPIVQKEAGAQFVQQGSKLVGTGALGWVWQGHSVSLSADGNTAIVGGDADNNAGAVWVYKRSGGEWSQQGSKLVGTGAVGNASQGVSVSLSADGNTAIVGGCTDDDEGAAWVFTRSGDVWNQQGSKLVGAGAVGLSTGGQGCSVSLSADGNTAIVGGKYDSGYVGAAWVFVRSGIVWSQQGNKLVGTGVVGMAYQGQSVSLSADGNTAIVGGYRDNGSTGAVWIFTRSSDVWSQQGSKIVGTGAVGAYFGHSVSLSADGNTALVGAYRDNDSEGAAWVFTRNAGVWSEYGSKLVCIGAVGSASYGYSVSLASDGNTALVGRFEDNGSAGATWVFTRSAGVWSQHGAKLVGTGAVGNASQGVSVSLSADGNTLIVGGYEDDGLGAAWVFTRNGDDWGQQGTKLVGTGAVGRAYQGISVSLSGDGNTAIVGGDRDNNSSTGAAWIFTRSGDAWSKGGSKLVGTEAVGRSWQGQAVSLSTDGNTAIVGGPYDNSDAGAAWIFSRSGSMWTQQGSKLVGAGAVGMVWLGQAVSLSAEGNTAIVGGDRDNSNTGAVWVFARTEGVWSQQGSKLVGTGAVGSAWQGVSVSLSGDGNTAIVGGMEDDGHAGAAWIFTKSEGVWRQQGSKLVGTGAVGKAWQGASVSLSAEGNTAIVGGPADNGGTGAAWIFTRSGDAWSQQRSKLVGTGFLGMANQGVSVSLSGDGNAAMVGGDYDNNFVGAVWVFTRSGDVWSQHEGKLVGTGAVGIAHQGCSVSLSAEGNTAIVGGWQDNGGIGAAWVFARGTTEVGGRAGEMPRKFDLSQNFPNPFNPSTTFNYALPRSSEVRLSVYDILGREVSVLVNERRDAGVHEVKFDCSNLASGVYLYRLQAGDHTQTKRLLLLR